MVVRRSVGVGEASRAMTWGGYDGGGGRGARSYRYFGDERVVMLLCGGGGFEM